MGTSSENKKEAVSHLLGRPFLVVPEIGVVVGWWWFDWSVLADRLDLVKKHGDRRAGRK